MSFTLSSDFSGKVAFVSGGASGIGQATAVAFGLAGAWVAVTDIDEDGGLRTVHMIQQTGGEALFFKCDISDHQAVEKMMKEIKKNMGRIDCAFNNAGVEGRLSNTFECTLENWQHVMDVNLRGVWLSMKYQIEMMLENGGGSIVNCSSVAGLVGVPDMPAYAASKHGVIGLTKSASLEFAKKNIRVNSICPGVIQTPMIDRRFSSDRGAFEKMNESEPMGRIGRAEEVSSAVIWLSSDQASFVTGHSLVVDGGWIAQ